MKIMIVEDEENIRDGIRNLVDWNQEGFEEPLLFSSAVEALVFLETETVDVVLTDLYMPVLNGIEFIRMLREQNQVCEVIILTGHERFELAREAIALGVKQYLLKPVTGQTLLTELHKVSREIQERMRLKDWVDIAKKLRVAKHHSVGFKAVLTALHAQAELEGGNQGDQEIAGPYRDGNPGP